MKKINPTNKIIKYFIVLLISASLYSIWLSQRYSADDLQYAMVIEKAVTGRPLYHPAGVYIYKPGFLDEVKDEYREIQINPRYLLEYPASILVVNLWKTLGWDGLVIIPILTFRILVGCFGLLLIALTIDQLTQDPKLVVLGSLGIAVSLAYWTYSTHLDQSINMIVIILLVVYLIMRQYKKTSKFDSNNFVVPFLLAFATLFNFTAVLISGIISLMVVVFDQGLTWKTRFLRFLRFNVIYGSLFLFIFIAFTSLIKGPQVLLDKTFWATATFSGHPEYKINVFWDLSRSVLGFAKGQITYPGAAGAFQSFWSQASQMDRIQFLGYYGVVIVLFLLPIGGLLNKNLRTKILSPENRAPFWVFTGIFILYSAFNLFWDPGYIKYWIIPLICWWFYSMIVIKEFQTLRPAKRPIALFATAGFIALSIVMNLIGLIGNESRFKPNELLEMQKALQESPSNALFISNENALDFYIAYFTRRNIISIELINYASNNNAQQLEKILASNINNHISDGGPIYVYGFTDSNLEWQNKIIAMAQGSQLQPAWEFSNLTIYQVVR